jgi:multimeric flavodoxin WrbA
MTMTAGSARSKKTGKRVLILSSSPRKGGNSDLLCDEFLKGAQAGGNVAEKVFLADHDLHFCTGCGACFTKATCSQKDEMSGLLEKMVKADVIVMATPVYFYTMSAQMKMFIDRTCARYREIRNKDFYFLLTAADGNKKAMTRTLEGFRGFTGCLEGAKEKGVVYGAGAWEAGEIRGTSAMNDAYEMGTGL